MNWDEKAYEHAEARSSEYFGHLPEQMFERGAKWMRDQLRTDEAIERVARAIARLEPNEKWPDETIIDDEYRAECHETARAAITALLGDTQCHP